MAVVLLTGCARSADVSDATQGASEDASTSAASDASPSDAALQAQTSPDARSAADALDRWIDASSEPRTTLDTIPAWSGPLPAGYSPELCRLASAWHSPARCQLTVTCDDAFTGVVCSVGEPCQCRRSGAEDGGALEVQASPSSTGIDRCVHAFERCVR